MIVTMYGRRAKRYYLDRRSYPIRRKCEQELEGKNYLYVRLSRFEPRGAFTREVVKNRYAFRISATSQALVEY